MKRTSKKKNARPRISATWERAYKGHVYWQGKTRLGKVTLAGKGRYTWEAAGRAGAADDLVKAKRAVELAVEFADKQLDLFQQ